MPKIRLTREEKNTYSTENPNPEWKIRGEEWIALSLNDKIGGYMAAYIPHVTITVEQEGKIHDIIPTYWEPEERVRSENYIRCNFHLGPFGIFRLNARIKSKNDPYLRSRMSIDLDPKKDEDKNIIFELLKFAEAIYEPGKYIDGHQKDRAEYEERIKKQLELMTDKDK